MFITEKIISIVAPHQCLVCEREGAVVCDWCLPDFAAALPDRCYKCKTIAPDSRVCKPCRTKSPLKHVWVRTDYEEPNKQLIHNFKFERQQAAAIPLARMMAEKVPFLSRDTIIAHVPTATSRVRKRGYDHAELLAQALAKELGLPCQTLLLRTTQTRQVRSSREQRLKQMEGAFMALKSGALRSQKVLLVDDIVTTGSTLESAARCLREAGAKTVDAVVFAQRQ